MREVGVIGATGTIDDAVTIPVEAIAEVGGGRARAARALERVRRGRRLAAERGRRASPSPTSSTRCSASASGARYRDHGFPMGNGYFVGASYRELAGARFLGLTIGYSIDMGDAARAG